MRNIYDMKNNMKNHTQNLVEKVFPDLILKYQNWAMQFLLLKCQVVGNQNILKLSCKPLAFTFYKAFLKNEKRPRTSLHASFCEWFSKKDCFSFYVLLIEQISLSSCLYLMRYWAICVLQLFVIQVMTS